MLHIYTDGAASENGFDGPGGWGMYIEETNEKYSGHEDATTNNRMELLGFYNALNYAAQCGDNVTIYCDSAYVVNCFTQKWYVNWRKLGWERPKHQELKNKDLWKMIIELYEQIADKVTIEKVKGHAGKFGNEIADALAVKAKGGEVAKWEF